MTVLDQPELSSILARLEPLLGEQQGEPEPLQGGITNRNYRVRFDGEQYVLRLPGKDTALLGIDREAERIANTAAAELGIAPAVVAHFSDCIVTRFIRCRAVSQEELAAAAAELAGVLRQLHDNGPSLRVRFWVPELVEAYAQVVTERGGKLPRAYAHAREVARRIAEAWPLRTAVPCHNDLLTANVIRERGGRLLLVDWEYAGMGDPFFDLANLSVNNDFDEAADELLLSAYLGAEPDSHSRAGLVLMRVMSDVREAAWAVVQGVISELEFDFAAYAQQHFERLEVTTSEPRFKDALRAAPA